jgi:hypothetical protein
MKRFVTRLTVFCWLLIAATSPGWLRAQKDASSSSSEDTTSVTTAKAKSKKSSKKRRSSEQPRTRSHTPSKIESGGASQSEIAAAKSSSKVWVNLDSGIYHKSGRWYGRTKNGKFMTEAEAKAAGYKASQRD